MVERYIEVTDEYIKQLEHEIDDLKAINEEHKKINGNLDSNKDAHISLLQDVLGDMRDQRKFLKTISIFLCVLCFILVVGISILGVWNQIIFKRIAENNVNTFVEFVSSLEINVI